MSNRTKGSKAVTATNGHPPKRSFAPTISAIATELSRLYELRETMGQAHCHQTKQGQAGCRTKPLAPFETLRDRAHAEAEALEVLLLQQDPGTTDEALALVCLIDTYFQGWAAQAYSDQDLPTEAEREWDQLTRALAAMARWLHRNGATSPILASHFSDRTMLPVEEQIAAVRQQATELAEWHTANKEARNNV